MYQAEIEAMQDSTMQPYILLPDVDLARSAHCRLPRAFPPWNFVWDAIVTNEATEKTIALFRCTQLILYLQR
jgi:hypothetical protein